jgi:hypothetical protein
MAFERIYDGLVVCLVVCIPNMHCDVGGVRGLEGGDALSEFGSESEPGDRSEGQGAA